MTHSRCTPLALATLGALAGLLSGCGGKDGPSGNGPPVATVTVSPATASVIMGQTRQLTATMKDASGATLTGRTVAWTSGTTSIATVNATSGLVTAVAVGSAEITATSEGKTGRATITVTPVPVATVTVTPNPASVAVGQTVALAATLKDASGATLTGRTVAWSSDKPGTASVNASSGLVTGVAAGTATITATSEGKTGTAAVTVTSTASPAFAMSLTPTSLSVQQGASGSAAVALTRSGGFTGGVTLAVTGAPTGVTATASPNPATGNSATLTVAVGASVAAGSYTLTVTGTGSGVASKSATLALTVTAAPPSGSFTLAISPTSLSVQQGASGTATVTITRSSFTGSVALAVSGAPTGLTATLAPTSTTGTSSTLTVAAAASLAVGSYPLTITGTATGLAARTATITVTVTASTSGGTSVTVGFCAEDAPIFVAYQDGSGAWKRATAGSANSYTFSVPSAGGGVAYITGSAAAGYNWSVLYATPAELNSMSGGGTPICGDIPGKTVNGTVAGLVMGQNAQIALGSAGASVFGGTTSAFTLNGVPEGPQDLIATRATMSTTGSFELTVDKVIIRRGLNPPDGGTLAVLDFNASEAFAPASARATLGNLGGDQGILFVSYLTNASSSASTAAPFYASAALLATEAPRTYYGVPTAKQASGDLHVLTAFATPPDASPTSSRFASQYFRTVGDRTLTLGPVLSTPTVTTAATTPYLRPRTQLAVQSQYNRLAFVGYTQSARSVTVMVTAGYRGSGGTWDFQIPDLSGLSGFSSTWGLQAGAATDWSVSATGGSFLYGFAGARPTDGASVLFASRTGTVGS